jgi:hypothetical protein
MALAHLHYDLRKERDYEKRYGALWSPSYPSSGINSADFGATGSDSDSQGV